MKKILLLTIFTLTFTEICKATLPCPEEACQCIPTTANASHWKCWSAMGLEIHEVDDTIFPSQNACKDACGIR
jgi:hypothetical protein